MSADHVHEKLSHHEIGDFGFVAEDDGRVFLCLLKLADPSPILSHEIAAQVIERLQQTYRKTRPEAIEDYNREIEAQGRPPYHEPPPPERRRRPGFIYLLRAENGLYKIGLTKNVNTRIKAIQNGSLLKIELLHTIRSSDMVTAEQILHARFEEKRNKGEWFALTLQDVESIMEITSL